MSADGASLAAFLASPTVQSALVVGAIVAVVAGIVGVFTVARKQSFAGHALADLGAVGGSGAFLVGISQLWGFIGAGIIAALLMETVGLRRIQGRDIATGVVFGFGMGLTALFLFWDTTIGDTSNAAISVLFGSLFVLDSDLIPAILVLGLVALAIIGAIYRWLLIESVDHDLAVARGVPVRATGIIFLIALALTVGLSSLTTGAILSTALLIGPASTALLLTGRVGRAAGLSAVLGVGATWAGCFISYESYYWAGPRGNWPVSFCIVAVVFLLYLGTRITAAIHRVAGRGASVATDSRGNDPQVTS